MALKGVSSEYEVKAEDFWRLIRARFEEFDLFGSRVNLDNITATLIR